MKEVPLVSVILPVYNAERYVKKAIESILMQDYSNIELILINDCSTDNSEHEIFKFQDERIRYVKNEKNLGLIKTLNKALLLCQGEFIARMDADDIAIQSRIRKQLQFLLENKDFVLVGSNYRVFGDKEGIVKLPSEDVDCRTSLATCSPFCHPATMFKTETIKSNNLQYNENYVHAEDFNFFQELSKFGKIKNLDAILLEYRVHRSQVSQVHRVQQLESRLSSALAYSNTSRDDFVSDIISYNKKCLNRKSLALKGLVELIVFCRLKVSVRELLYIFFNSRWSLFARYLYWRMI